MSTKKSSHTISLRALEQKSTQSEAVPPPDAVVALAQTLLDTLNYLSSRDDTTELSDAVKPRLEAIIRRAT